MGFHVNALQFDTWLTEQQKTHEIYAPKCFPGGNTFSDVDCIGCLRCLNGIMFGKRVACTINPSFELVNEDTLREAEVKKNVLVIGGGAKVGNIKDAISGAYELPGTL